jgi:hypothetical protein
LEQPQLINVLALLVALAAVATSTFLARLALRLNHNANLMRIVLEALEKQRRGKFTATEIALLEELPKHEAGLGFARLPAPVLEDAFEVACYYQHLSTLAEYGVADWDFIAVQVEHRMLKVWDCIQPYVYAERNYRGNENGFLNNYERFAARVRSADMRAASERLYDRGRRRQMAVRLPVRRPGRVIGE